MALDPEQLRELYMRARAAQSGLNVGRAGGVSQQLEATAPPIRYEPPIGDVGLEAEGLALPPAAPPPLLEPAGAAMPDLTMAPPADAEAPFRDLGVSVNRRLTGAAGEPFFTNRPAAELAADGGRGGFVRATGGPAPAPPPRPETPGEAALSSAGARVKALQDLRSQLVMANPNDPRLANVEAQFAQATQGYQGAVALPTTEAQAARAVEEARTAPGAREKAEMEQGLKREEIAGRTAAASVQGLQAHEVAARLGLDTERIKGMNQRELEALRAGAARAEKAFDRETKRGEISGTFLKEIAIGFNAIQAEKDPVKKQERMGEWLQSVKAVQDLLISGRGGAPARGAATGTPATPDLRTRAQAAYKQAGRPPLKPGDQFKASGKVYTY